MLELRQMSIRDLKKIMNDTGMHYEPKDVVEKDDMVRYMSLAGVIAFSDHEQTGEENDDVIDDCREQATDELIGQLLKLYEPAELAKSRLVTRWATVLACYYLCRT